MEIEFSVRITPEEKRQQFYASLAFSAAAVFSGIFVGLHSPALCWIGLIGIVPSFAPYRKICAQEKYPDRLRLEGHTLVYFTKGKKALSIPFIAISRLEYKQGLAVYLKHPPPKKIAFEWFGPKVYDLLKARLHDVVQAN